MIEFNFLCPKCQQNITVGQDSVSQPIECPHCQANLIVPLPAKDNPFASAPAPKPASASPMVTVPPISDRRVAVLTPEVKLEIVRAARERLADKSHWMSGKREDGLYNYAARQEGDKLVPVEPTDASATHISLFGAMMLEFHRHNVTRITKGRQHFLDEELGAAIRNTLGRKEGDQTVDPAGRTALSHEQCLKVLDVFEKQLVQDTKTLKQKNANLKIDLVHLQDLLQKMENNLPIRTEEVICALYYELEELKQRLEKLESNGSDPK